MMVTVSVNMAGKLKATLRCNKPLMERIIVITSTKDRKTQRVCAEEKVECHVTGAMYENGDVFNKGRAIQEVQRELLQAPASRGSFIIIVDSDICLPSTTWSELPGTPQRDVLYTSTSRCLYNMPAEYTAGRNAREFYCTALTLGMFQAYRLDPGTPLYPDAFPTAATSDMIFARAFRNVTKLELWVAHLGYAVNRDWQGFRGDADRWADAAPPPDGACPCCYPPNWLGK